MKSLRNKVIMSAIVLAFALIATIGSTYAWFTVSSSVSATGLTLNVQTQNSLLIKTVTSATEVANDVLDPTEYKTTLTTADFATTFYTGMSGWTLYPVTAATGNVDGTDTVYTGLNADALTFYNPTSDLATAISTTLTTGDVNKATTGSVIELRMWLMAQASNQDVVFTDLSITPNSGNALSAQDEVVNAVCLGVKDVTNSGTRYIFSIDPDYGFAFVSGDLGYEGDATDSILSNTALLADHSLFYGASTVANESTTVVGDATVVASLVADTPTLISIYIYIEGWDAEATNGIVDAAFDLSFGFEIQP